MTTARQLPTEIIVDLTQDLQAKVHDQIMLKVRIADHPKDMFLISLGALASSLGLMAGLFSVAYGIPKSKDMGRLIALEVFKLGEEARDMTEAEWEAFGRKLKE
jgi:hypothetical protein